MGSRDRFLRMIIITAYIAVLILLYGTTMNWIRLSKKGTENSRLIGASYMTMNNEFYDILNEQIRVRVEGEGDLMVLRDPGLDVSRQVSQINSMLSMGISALIVTPVTSDGLSEVLDRARKMGVKIIVVDTELENQKQADCTIVSNNFRAGYMIGQYIMEKQSSGRILVLNHESVISSTHRVSGLKEAIYSDPNFQIVKEISCKGQYEIALPLVEEYIRSGGEFDTVFCLNDLAGEAAVTAIRSHPELKDVLVYGIDGSPDAKSMIQSGDMEATAAQFPTQIGEAAAETLYRMLEGEEYVPVITLPVDLINKENLDRFDIHRWQ
ncbi:MAG: sugar ABC transporter substrate-binding protein [bacterium]